MPLKIQKLEYKYRTKMTTETQIKLRIYIFMDKRVGDFSGDWREKGSWYFKRGIFTKIEITFVLEGVLYFLLHTLPIAAPYFHCSWNFLLPFFWFILLAPPRSPQQSCLLSCEKCNVYKIRRRLSDPLSFIRSMVAYQIHRRFSNPPSMTCLNVSM